MSKGGQEYNVQIQPSDNDPDDDEAQTGAGAILQFSTATFYCKEGEESEASIDVMRLGDDSSECSCMYETKDASAKAGVKYKAVSGELKFLPGEAMKQIQIPIINDEAWDTSLEFEVRLSNGKNCLLGRYLFQSRVIIIDDDSFPTNRFKEAALKNDYSLVNRASLLLEYFKMNFRNKIVRKGTYKIAVLSQISNLYLFWRLFLTKALIDNILSDKEGACPAGTKFLFDIIPCPQDEDAKVGLLITFAILLIVPFLLVHLVDYRKCFWKVGGVSRKTIQSNLLRKYLNYDIKSRDSVKPADVTMAMSTQSFELVSQGYMQIFPLALNAGRLLSVVILQLYMGLTPKKGKETPPIGQLLMPVIVVILFPIPLFIFLYARKAISERVKNGEVARKNDLVEHVNNVMRDFRLIADYQKRTLAVDQFDGTIGAYNGAATQAAAVDVNNKYMAPWLSSGLGGFWFIVGGIQVVKGETSLGSFLTTLSIFREVGKAWSAIYNILLTLQKALDSLVRIVTYMNLPVDVEKRLKLNRRRRFLGEQARKLSRQNVSEEEDDAELEAHQKSKYAADKVPIKITGLAYKYEIWGGSPSNGDANSSSSFGVLPECSFQIRQGSFVALVGAAGEGKSTILQLIGGVLIPDEGDLLVPPHLRVLHVSNQPFFTEDTMFNNLVYGLKPNDPDASHERVKAICTRLGIQNAILDFINPQSEKFKEKSSWNEVLSLTQRMLLHIARAFIANREVLVIHKPTTVFDEVTAHVVFDAFRDFVRKKGLEMDPKEWEHRRPRTAIISTSRMGGVARCDRVFHVSKEGVSEKKKELIDGELLK